MLTGSRSYVKKTKRNVKDKLNVILNVNETKVTLNHFLYQIPVHCFFYFLGIFICPLTAFIPSFKLFLNLLDPDPGGHRMRTQCRSGSGSKSKTLNRSNESLIF
jgi:hypothetical protein